jgi:salicylate hydroxylase
MTGLQVAIVGGGIGGVAAANALLQRGVEARVYEQAPVLREVGAGVALAPNGIRVLRRLGYGDALGKWGARWVETRYIRSDGTEVGPMLHPNVEQYGFHRADLLELLARDLAEGTVHTGFQATGFEQDDEQATVAFANGEVVSADVVIGVDGIHSTLQSFVTAPSKPLFSNTIAYRGVLDCASVGWPHGAVRNWLGFGKHFLAYPLRGGELLNWVAFVPTDEQMKESWSAPGDPAVLAAEYEGWDPALTAIISRVETTFRWGLYDREPLPRWTNGRLTLLGDAAHPMLPHAGQGANQAIEDALALAVLLADADREMAPGRLLAYESLRRERTTRVQRLSRARGSMKESASEDRTTRDLARATEELDQGDWLRDYDVEAAAVAVLGQ